ncbi:MAG: CRISPR-associated helicase Cas3', partial [Thiohalospira sp.]
MSYERLFERAMGQGARPYPYQQRLAEGPWPEVVNVPTGLGKTAAITLAWAYRRGIRAEGGRAVPEAGIPRRLVWCLPMRVLVEQTVDNARAWLQELGVLGEPGEPGTVAVHTLMGGEPDLRQASWAGHPEQEAILVGTQDMLLSRALMRGYGMSRYQWPVHYGLLHNDALWVFDEVQLMGPALPTTTQLEAFRRDLGVAAPARSTWVSATLREDWLDTVDFRGHRERGLQRLELDGADRAEEPVRRRVGAAKELAPAQTQLVEAKKPAVAEYIRSLAEEIREAHCAGQQTLVIVNRVERAQALYDALEGSEAERLLLHARFRPAERAAIEQRLQEPVGEAGRIVVATQAVEAGVDLDSRVLFTELAPWASLVQRFGRCNRAGRFEEARIRWIDLNEEVGDLALPYEADSLAQARQQLRDAASAAPQDLPPVTESPATTQVLRRRDLLDLFNTDPDLSGFDVDISPYIRDTGTPPVQVFWREVAGNEEAAEQIPPGRAELCNVSVVQLRDHLGKKLSAPRKRLLGREGRLAWRLDPIAGRGRAGRWVAVRADEIRPGQTVLLAASDGGYDPDKGFVPGKDEPVAVTAAGGNEAEGYGSDLLTHIGRQIPLPEHLADVAGAMNELGRTLEIPEEGRWPLETAARWHDVGKAHEAFQ